MFMAHLQQQGGCDYTIGCGHSIEKLTATTRAEAIEELRLLFVGKYVPKQNCFEDGYRGERELNTATLYEITSAENMPLNEWYQYSDNLMATSVQKNKDEAELKEFERLRKKFGK